MKLSSKEENAAAVAAVLSDIGDKMLSCRDYATAAANVALLVSNTLGVTHAMVLRLLPAGDALLLEGGTGWRPGMVGHAVFDTSEDSLAGFALSSSEPVVIEDLRMETRFTIPAHLSGYGLVSGLCARIPCQYQSSGVLAVFSTGPRSFSQEELACLRMALGMLAVSSGCQRTGEVRREDQEKIAQAKQEWEATVDALPHFICLLDEQRRIVRANRSLDHWIPAPVSDVRGFTVHELLHPGCKDPACYMVTLRAAAWGDVLNGRHFEYEVEDTVLKRRLAIQLRPTIRHAGVNGKDASRAVLVVEDITKIRHAEEVLKRSNHELERLVQARAAELVQANEHLKCEIVERRRIEAALRRSENEMRLLSAQLLTAQEMERKRIASELHDGISQSLSAIKFCMENALGRWRPESGDRDMMLIRSVIPKMQAAIDEVRRISMNLRPAMLDDLGIIPTIAWFCREFGAVYADIQVDTHIELSENDVSAPLKTIIYRVMQEALNNIVKHARAKRAGVYLRKVDSAIELVVQDDGVGFDLNAGVGAEPHEHFGILGMRERAEFSGGTFFITSSNETGTVVRASWPWQS
jgi:signal transduction histidine kinase